MASLWQRISTAFVRKSSGPDWGTLERYLAWAFGGGASASGVVVNPQNAMQAGAVFACIKVLAESVGMLPCNLQRKKPDGSREMAESHPLYYLLHDQPNDYQTSVEFWEMVVLHLCLRGNAFAFVNRTKSGEVVELLPQHPDMVRVTMQNDYRLLYEIMMPDGTYRQFSNGDVFHVRGMTLNGWLGISPIAYARESIGLALATEKFGGQLFRNGAKMGGILEHPNRISDDAYKRIKDSFDAATSGENAHKTQLLEEGMKYTKISMSSEDAQFLETRKYQRSEIAAIYRVPPHLIGDLEKATFSNIEQQALEFVTYSLTPWLVRIERAVKRDLLSPAERKLYTLRFNAGAMLRGDAKSRAEYYASGITNGWLTRNEARAAEIEFGQLLNSLPDLDKPLMPMNMREAGTPVVLPDKPGAPAEPPAPGAADSATAKAIGELAHAIATQPPPTANVHVDSPIVKFDVDSLNLHKTMGRIDFIEDADGKIVGAQPVLNGQDN